MNISDFLSPLARQKTTFIFFTLVLSGIFLIGLQLIPTIQKTTIYFPVKPLKSTQENNITILDTAESTSKVAEMISGWAKDPGFRQDLLNNAGIQIPNFKRQLSARKQNRMNVFWTLTLYGEEITQSEKLTAALLTTFNDNFEEFNQNRSIQYGINTPSVFRETVNIPIAWILCAALFFGTFLTIIGLYLSESLRKKVSFTNQIKNIFRKAPLLKIEEEPGAHDEKLLKQFLQTFESPRLIGVFPEAEKHFSITTQDLLENTQDTPILFVKLGTTSITDLENLEAIYGKNVGIIVFEK